MAKQKEAPPQEQKEQPQQEQQQGGIDPKQVDAQRREYLEQQNDLRVKLKEAKSELKSAAKKVDGLKGAMNQVQRLLDKNTELVQAINLVGRVQQQSAQQAGQKKPRKPKEEAPAPAPENVGEPNRAVRRQLGRQAGKKVEKELKGKQVHLQAVPDRAPKSAQNGKAKVPPEPATTE